mmetsp:Transcript_29565/g.47211  ORF Transcript_29565/g.47211 Transcript_29565/m.47211 type:complete len:206 (-) Transcript_29565:573-1190(-)
MAAMSLSSSIFFCLVDNCIASSARFRSLMMICSSSFLSLLSRLFSSIRSDLFLSMELYWISILSQSSLDSWAILSRSPWSFFISVSAFSFSTMARLASSSLECAFSRRAFSSAVRLASFSVVASRSFSKEFFFSCRDLFSSYSFFCDSTNLADSSFILIFSFSISFCSSSRSFLIRCSSSSARVLSSFSAVKASPVVLVFLFSSS